LCNIQNEQSTKMNMSMKPDLFSKPATDTLKLNSEHIKMSKLDCLVTA
jgi:hypothetical protein